MVPQLPTPTQLPEGNTPVSNAGKPGEVEPMTTPPPIETHTFAGAPAVAKLFVIR